VEVRCSAISPPRPRGLTARGVAGGGLMSEVESMAVYEFECKACGKHFEVSVPISEHDRLKKRPPKCPKCGKSRVQQLVSSFSTKAPSKY
jgi:putative FmdB family regulatory protein